MKKGLLISLGGTPAPLINSINYHRPDVLLFFTSKETQKYVSDVISSSAGNFGLQDAIVTPSSENFTICFETLYKELPKKMELYEVSYENLIVDFTGGTKNMSAAMALATAEFTREFSYVGGKERTKEGVGVVINGEEYLYNANNPWDALAIPSRKRISLLFNKARFTSAAEEIKMVKDRVSPQLKMLFDALYDTVEGFYNWDNFRYKKANDLINKGIRKLKDYAGASGDKELENWTHNIERKLLPVIKKLYEEQQKQKFSDTFIKDLLANASRRGKEHKHDDAVIRHYSCIEHFAKVCLDEKHGINNSSVPPDQIPENIREEFTRKYKEEDENLKLPLKASYRLLSALKDPLGEKFMKMYDTEIHKYTGYRNNSPVIHGLNPVTEKQFQQMFNFICDLYEINPDDLIQFPELKL